MSRQDHRSGEAAGLVGVEPAGRGDGHGAALGLDQLGERIQCAGHDRRAGVSHLLDQVPYETVEPDPITLPDRPAGDDYERPPRELYRYVPAKAAELKR